MFTWIRRSLQSTRTYTNALPPESRPGQNLIRIVRVCLDYLINRCGTLSLLHLLPPLWTVSVANSSHAMWNALCTSVLVLSESQSNVHTKIKIGINCKSNRKRRQYYINKCLVFSVALRHHGSHLKVSLSKTQQPTAQKKQSINYA